MIRTVHTAKYVLAEAGLLLRNAAVHVSDPGRISRIEPWHGPPLKLETKVVDWGDAIILPGLVNSHTHLELSRLSKESLPASSFTGWLSGLIRERGQWTPEAYLEAVTSGAMQSMASGTTLVADISASGWSRQALKWAKVRKVVFEEVVSLAPGMAITILDGLIARLERAEPDHLLSCSASPHAPYSVSAELYRATAEMAHQRGVRLATHVAETLPELEFLKSGSGEFRDFLDRLGVLPDGWVPPRMTPIAYLDSLGVLAKPALLVHCNYLDEDSMSRILSRNCSVVYCPRSHSYFGHQPHPVRRMLDMGINVALGTDSLACNDSLSVLDEMRFLFKNRPDLKCDEIFRMATLNGAVALDFGGVLGRLRRGSWADMTVLRLPETLNDRNLMAQILEGAGECQATIVAGEIVFTDRAD